MEKLNNTPGNITDLLGPCPEQAGRVAVKVADEVIDRSADVKRRGYVMESQTKKPAEKDVNAAHARMSQSSEMCAAGAGLTMAETAVSLQSRHAAARRMNEAGILSANSGMVAAQIPDVRDLCGDMETGFSDGSGRDSDSQEGDVEEEDEEAKEQAAKAGKGKKSPQKKQGKDDPKQKASWEKRTEDLIDKQATHQDWTVRTRAALDEAIHLMQDARDKVPVDAVKDLQSELNLLNTRLRAARLVVGSEQEDRTTHTLTADNLAGLSGSSAGEDDSKKKEAAQAEDPKSAEDKKVAEEREDEDEDKKVAEEKEDKKVAEDEKPAQPTDQEPAAAPSTIARYTTLNGNNSVRALKRYIASFGLSKGQDDDSHALGVCVPCRTFRMLKCMSEFQDLKDKYASVITRVELKNVEAAGTPHKAALRDLIAAGKASVALLKKAVDRYAELKKVQQKSASVDGRQTKRKAANMQNEAADSVAALESIAVSVAVVTVTIGENEALEIESFESAKPCVLRLPSALIQTGDVHKDSTSMQRVFMSKPERADPGRML